MPHYLRPITLLCTQFFHFRISHWNQNHSLSNFLSWSRCHSTGLKEIIFWTQVRPYKTEGGEELLILQEGIRSPAEVFRCSPSQIPLTGGNLFPNCSFWNAYLGYFALKSGISHVLVGKLCEWRMFQNWAEQQPNSDLALQTRRVACHVPWPHTSKVTKIIGD